MKRCSVSLIALCLCSCKSLEMNSLVHPHVTNRIHISLSDEVKRVINEERSKENKRLKEVHDFEEITMKKEHAHLEKKVMEIHKQAEIKTNERFSALEERIVTLIGTLMNQKNNNDTKE